MLASPRLEDGMRAFFDDMLGFDDFDALSKDPMVYPFFSRARPPPMLVSRRCARSSIT